MEKDNEILILLREKYRNSDWFYDAGFDQFGRPVVYIKYECHETLYDIPDRIDGKQLLVHFAASMKTNKDCFSHKQSTSLNELVASTTQSILDIANMTLAKADPVGAWELSVDLLVQELDSLEQICGPNILQEIFYESHDKQNAVTNMSLKYPEVRRRMSSLYDRYGFDIVYEYLEGE